MAFDPKEAVDFLRQVSDAESSNRADCLEDLRFSYGEQWPVEVQNSRTLESRPCLTINKVDSYIRQVTNSQRQQRPRIKAHPMDSAADPKIAEVLTGLIRHIEINSDADNAYDTAFDFAARIGFGYFRVVTDYMREDSFDQDIYVQQVENPFTVYFDPNSTLPDGSDAEKCLITDLISKDTFKSTYPDADEANFDARATGDSSVNWITKEDIRIAEYFSTEYKKAKLVMLSDKSTHWMDQLPPMEVLQQAGIQIVGDRDSMRKSIQWHKVTAFDVLETKEWQGRWIPVIPVYGDMSIIDGKRKRFGLVRNARDPQMMYNFWRTAMTESVAMAPKAKWLMAEGQDEGHENEWNTANVSARAVLRYKMTDTEGREAGKPERLQPEPPPGGMMEAASAISNDLQAVLGIFDPSMGKPSGPKSGKAIRAEQGQSEQSNFHYYDNLTRSLKHLGKQILDLVPKVYDTERVMRIIGDDGKPDLVTLNQPNPQAQQQQGQPQDQQQQVDPNAQAVQAILNDVTVGTYDVVMEVGPGFNSKRAESVDAMTQMLQGNPDLFKQIGDLVFRNMDFPGADIIADRLASVNPLAKIDEKSDIPPQAQMMIKNLQTQLQQVQQQAQQMEQVIKSRSDVEQMKQAGETQREHMRTTVKAHESEVWAQEERDQFESVERTKRHDTEVAMHTKAHDAALGYKKAMDVEEVRAHLAILLAKLGEQGEAEDNAIDSAI